MRVLLPSFLLCFSFFRVHALPGYGSYPPSPSSCPMTPTGADDPNYQEKLGLFLRFADAFMYPNNTIQASTINSTLFAENIQGRVDLTSTFDGRELNTEYLFGLFSTIANEVAPGIFNILGVPINYTLTGFTATGSQVVGSFIFNDLHQGDITLPVEVILFMKFNDAGEITEYDATIRRADWFFDVLKLELSPLLAAAVNLTTVPTPDQITQILILLTAQSVCEIHELFCLGANQQYASHAACLQFMTALPFGQPYQLGQNTSGCRSIHQNMVPLRPSVHCPHIGPSGGNACIPRDYVQVTTQKYFNVPFTDPFSA